MVKPVQILGGREISVFLSVKFLPLHNTSVYIYKLQSRNAFLLTDNVVIIQIMSKRGTPWNYGRAKKSEQLPHDGAISKKQKRENHLFEH